jgi:uncharacterized protein
MSTIVRGEFEWDEAKARLNIMHPGVSFEEAASVFDDPLGVPYVDEEHSREERRYVILGASKNGSGRTTNL